MSTVVKYISPNKIPTAFILDDDLRAEFVRNFVHLAWTHVAKPDLEQCRQLAAEMGINIPDPGEAT